MMGHNNLYASANWASQEGKRGVVQKTHQDSSTLMTDSPIRHACLHSEVQSKSKHQTAAAMCLAIIP